MPEWGKTRRLQDMRAKNYRITAWGAFLCEVTLEIAMRQFYNMGHGDVTSILGQLEKCPRTERLHGQLFVVFKKELRGVAAKKMILAGLDVDGGVTQVWIDQADATPWSNRLYCTKMETREALPTILGKEIKKTGSGQGARTDIAKVVDRLHAGERLETMVQEPEVAIPYVRFHSGFGKLQDLLRRNKGVKKGLKVLWFWGPAGSNKTRTAVEGCGDLEYVLITGAGEKRPFYHDDYIPGIHDVVIYDDLRPLDMNYNTLLQVLDIYPITVDCRNVNKPWLVNKIIITSCSHPRDFASNGEDVNQLLRRITSIREFSL